MSNLLFTTHRLSVRHLTLDDLSEFYKMQSNPNVMKFIKPALNYKETKAELLKFIGYYSDPKKFYKIWAVTEITNNQFVGICGVYKNHQAEFEIAYRLTQSAWGNKYGSEIAASLIPYLRSKLKIKKLVAYVNSKNIPSVKILEKFMTFVEESKNESTDIKIKKYCIHN